MDFHAVPSILPVLLEERGKKKNRPTRPNTTAPAIFMIPSYAGFVVQPGGVEFPPGERDQRAKRRQRQPPTTPRTISPNLVSSERGRPRQVIRARLCAQITLVQKNPVG